MDWVIPSALFWAWSAAKIKTKLTKYCSFLSKVAQNAIRVCVTALPHNTCVLFPECAVLLQSCASTNKGVVRPQIGLKEHSPESLSGTWTGLMKGVTNDAGMTECTTGSRSETGVQPRFKYISLQWKGEEDERDGRWKQRGREIERVKRKYVTLGWVQGLRDGEGASLFYFRLTRLCAPFLSVAPSLFHTMLFFLLCPHCSVSLTPPPPSSFSVTFLRDAPRRKKRTWQVQR